MCVRTDLNGGTSAGIYSGTMKTMAVAAMAALLVVARTASAGGAGSPGPVDDEVSRAATEARALVSTMQNNARVARQALEYARRLRRPEAARCSDEALSLADVALRRGREEAALMADQFASKDRPGARASLERLRMRASASHDAAVSARACNAPEIPPDRTVVVVRVAPSLLATM
jgi:hypothetical protein